MNLKDELKKLVRGDVADDAATLSTYSRGRVEKTSRLRRARPERT